MNKRVGGFTIVELLIVIVVIAILAAITIVSYNGIQARATDSRLRAGAQQIEKALRQYSLDNSPTTLGGLNSTTGVTANGCNDGVSGWFVSGSYLCTPEDALVVKKLLPSGFTSSLPANSYYGNLTTGRYSIMFYKCGTEAGRYALFWTLKSPSSEESAQLDSIISTCGNTQVRDSWGMRAGKFVYL